MEKRKVLFTNSTIGDKQIIITDAPDYAIMMWCRRCNRATDNGESIEPFDSLKAQYLVKELYDSEIDDSELLEVIGYDETYEISDYRNGRIVPDFVCDEYQTLDEAVKEYGKTIGLSVYLANRSIRSLDHGDHVDMAEVIFEGLVQFSECYATKE